VLATGLLGSLLAWLVVAAPAAGGQSARPAYQPRADYIGVVVTSGEVLMSWHRLGGADAGTPIVRRGQGVCPHTSADGIAIGELAPLHIIDRSVLVGRAYCYTLFSRAADGAVRMIGNSGLVTVPDASVPPEAAPAPAPAPTVTVSALTPARERMLVLAGGVVAILLLGLVGSVRRAVMPSTAREWILDRPTATVVVPVLIAFGWMCLLIALVGLR
jgi:hypothetical protein